MIKISSAFDGFAFASVRFAIAFCIASCGGTEAPSAQLEQKLEKETATIVSGVEVDIESQEKLGISVAPLVAAHFAPTIEGPAIVVDVQQVVKPLAELTAAETAAGASAAAFGRAKDVFAKDTSISKEVLEAAERQAATDTAQLAIAQVNAIAPFGHAPWLDASRRLAMIDALTTGRANVIKASFPSGLPQLVSRQLAFRNVGEKSGDTWTASEVWVGPAEPQIPGPVLYGFIANADDLVSGQRLVASVSTGNSLEGVRIPAASVVVAGGTTWVYLAIEEDVFVRTAVKLSRPIGGQGYFEQAPFVPGEMVVVAGAGLLLARESSNAQEAE